MLMHFQTKADKHISDVDGNSKGFGADDGKVGHP